MGGSALFFRVALGSEGDVRRMLHWPGKRVTDPRVLMMFLWEP